MHCCCCCCCCCCCEVVSVVSDSVGLHRPQPTRLPSPWDSPGKNTGVACHFLLQCMKVKSESEVAQSCLTLCNPHGLYSPWNSPGQDTGVGILSLLQGIFPIQGSNLGLPHCSQILYQLSHKGSPRILECAVYTFSSGSYQCRDQTRVSCTAGGLFTN